MKRRLFYLTVFSAIFFLVLFSFSPIAQAVSYPADPDSFKQWYLEKVGAYDGWSKTKGSSNIVVAVLDTGVDIDHPDLKDNIWENKGEIIDGRDNDGNIYIDDFNGWDFVDGDSDPRPNLSEPGAQAEAIHHGTLIAGLIGAMGDNGIGVTGLAWRIKIMPLRVLDSQGQGDVGTVEEAIRYAIDKKVDIINLSFVGPGFDKRLFLTLRDAYRAGILVVAAVGNQAYEGVDLDHDPLYPVCYSGVDSEDVVLGVAAVDKDDRKPNFSNYGKNCVDLVAPGVDIYNTMVYKPSFGYNQMFGGGFRGTSLAAPIVSGTAALMKSLNPSLKPAEIQNILLSSADPLPEGDFKNKMGRGRINVRRALEMVKSGGVSAGDRPIGVNYLLSAPYTNNLSEVKISNSSGTLIKNFKVYPDFFRKGVRVVGADINGDRIDEIITGTAVGGGPQVRVFRSDGRLLSSFFAYDKSFRGGVNVAAGDVDNDGQAEIITGMGSGGSPEIKIFRSDGRLLSSFFAYDKSFRGGVQVTAGDVDNDGRADIIIFPGPGLEPKVRVFNFSGANLLNFLAFPGNIKLGVNAVFGDVDGDGEGDFVVSLMSGGLSEVRVFNSRGSWQRAFLAYPEKFKGGVSLAIGDLDRDGTAEIIAGAGPGAEPELIIFTGYGKIKNKFYPFDKKFKGGISVGVIKL